MIARPLAACLVFVLAAWYWAASGWTVEGPKSEAKPDEKKTTWGRLTTEKADQLWTAEVANWPAAGAIMLPTAFPNITRAYLAGDRERKQIPLEFNSDASLIQLHIPARPVGAASPRIVLEIGEKSGQHPDGRIVFSAPDAKVTGQSARLESHPGNHRIGFWTNPEDSVSWDYQATRPGRYQVELTYSRSGGEGTEVSISLGETTLAGKLSDTGSFYKYTAVSLGTLAVPAPGKQTLAVRCTKKVGGAVMNLKAVTLRPISEGKAIAQAADGTITCHARDVIIHGTKVQWEPKPEKQTVGYWVNESDTIEWQFAAEKKGDYEVEILQGCGKGQGGSEVSLSLGNQVLKFIVEDTGHFQNFVPRRIGRLTLSEPGSYSLEVRPISKKAGAIMDLRQVRLLPASDK